MSPLRHGPEISDVNDLLGANESTRVFVALGACSVAQSTSNESSERRHLARPSGGIPVCWQKAMHDNIGRNTEGRLVRAVWRVEALPNTHENFTGGATFVDHSDSRGSLFYRELRTDDGIQDS